MKKRTEPKPKRSAASILFVIVLLAFAVAILALLTLWFIYKNTAFLYAMLGVFGVYIVCLVVGLSLMGKREKKAEKTEKLLKAALSEGPCLVYLAYFGGERHVKKPSQQKQEYLLEIYEPQAKDESLKKHLWFGLSEKEEHELTVFKRYETRAAYPTLSLLEGQTVYVAAGFFEAAKDSPAFREFFNKNHIVIYGDN